MTSFPSIALGASALAFALVFCTLVPASAQPPGAPIHLALSALGDLTPYRTIASDTLALVDKGDIPAARRFCEALGLTASWVADSGTWVSLEGSGGGLGLHDAASGEPPRPSGTVQLSFESEEPLEQVADRLLAAGFEAAIIDESFGRSLRTTSPDGEVLQINESHPLALLGERGEDDVLVRYP